MTLLYRVEDEIAIEMSSEAWGHVVDAMGYYLAQGYPNAKIHRELKTFLNAIRSHLQHLGPLSATMTLTNDDLR